jgi:hypothetical protein
MKKNTHTQKLLQEQPMHFMLRKKKAQGKHISDIQGTNDVNAAIHSNHEYNELL